MSFHERFIGCAYAACLLQLLLLVAIVITLHVFYYDNVNTIGFAPEGNPGNDSYSTSDIQHEPIRQCQEDLDNLEDKLCTDMKGSAEENEHLITAICDLFQISGKISIPVIYPRFLNNRQHTPTEQEPRENVWHADDSDAESVCSENEDISEYGSLTKESQAIQETDQTADTSQQVVSHSEDSAAVSVTMKCAKVDDGGRAAESGSNHDFASYNDDSSDQLCEEANEPSNSDGDVIDSSTNIVVAHSVTDEEKSSSMSDEVEISQQLESDDSTSSVYTVETVPSAEPSQMGIQDSVDDGDGITMSTSVEDTRNSFDLLCEEAGTSDVSDFDNEDSPRGAVVPVETNSGNKFEEENDKGHQTTEEEFRKELCKEGDG